MGHELRGIVALVTRPAGQGAALASAIRAAGGEALECPLLDILPLPLEAATLARLLDESSTAIFISTNAVAAALAAVREAGLVWPPGLRALAVGSATRDALIRAGIAAEAGEGTAMNSEELLAHTALAQVEGQQILIFKGEGGRELLAEALRARGARVEECALYRRSLPDGAATLLETLLDSHRVNTFLASSGETLAHLLGLLGRMPAGKVPAEACFVVPGERVAAEARHRVPAPVVMARNASDAAMLEALATFAKAPGCKAEHS
jgi:uroporphyrinogen-III synthase